MKKKLGRARKVLIVVIYLDSVRLSFVYKS
jgi:hypothetical protein